jgi:MtrB/PioB family decaheme-associated outer membrane protein
MNIVKQHVGLDRTIIALALVAAFGRVQAEEAVDASQPGQPVVLESVSPGSASRGEGVEPAKADSVASGSAGNAGQNAKMAKPVKPQSQVSLGPGGVSGDSRERALFGQYNGLRRNKDNFLLDADVNIVDDATGVWTAFQGRNLGLDDREFRFSQKKQGDWKYSAEFSKLVRNYPRTVNTGVQGAGTTTPSVNLLAAPGAGSDVELKTTRKSVALSVEKWLSPSLQFEASFKNEDKDGARLFGRGFGCTTPNTITAASSGSTSLPAGVCLPGAPTAGVSQWALLMLPEPINSRIQQFEGKLNFSGERLMVSGGYYGSFYENTYGSMTPSVPGTLNNPLGAPTALNADLLGILQQPIALPPDNQAHQLALSGTYGLTPTTRATFKYAYTHATQKEDFASMGLTGAPAGVGNLGGVVDTSLAQLGVTSRPMPKLSTLANVRYENKNDKTPVALYNTLGTGTFTNGHNSSKKLAAKLEASYQLPGNYRATLGGDYESVDRGAWTSTAAVGGVTGMRQKTAEQGWRAELRRSMFDTLGGAIGYASSRRNGSDWLRPNTVANAGTIQGVTPVSDAAIYNRTGIFPLMFMDRKRDKVKLSADWAPTDEVSLQFVVEEGKDSYSAPTTKGLRDTAVTLYSIDATYVLSDMWKLTGYVSRSDQTIHVDHSSGYLAALRDINNALSIGVAGKISGQIEVGGDVSYMNDSNRYGQALDSAASAANATFFNQQGGLPDVTFRQTSLKVFGKYALEKNADIRVNLIHQRAMLNEWTWGYNGVPFVYSDNTTVSMNQNQNVSFIGATYNYKF